MIELIYDGSLESHPDSFRLAPYPRLHKGVPVEVDKEAADILLKCKGVKKAPAKKAD